MAKRRRKKKRKQLKQREIVDPKGDDNAGRGQRQHLNVRKVFFHKKRNFFRFVFVAKKSIGKMINGYCHPLR